MSTFEKVISLKGVCIGSGKCNKNVAEPFCPYHQHFQYLKELFELSALTDWEEVARLLQLLQ